MNILGNFANLTHQGPLFWAAAAAVAGGLTLVFVSLVIHLRKTIKGGLWRLPKMSWRTPFTHKKTAAHQPKVSITENGYNFSGSTPATKIPSSNAMPKTESPADTKVLEGLLQRLRLAGDHLEELQNPSMSHQSPNNNSLLKQQGDNVEYLIRTGIS
jgi:hypothetical protein